MDFRVDEARRAHARHWALTPLRGKKPILKKWTAQPHPDLATVEQWAREGNVGVRTGNVSGIVVVDDDTPDASGTASLALPRTPTVITGSGKRHLYFECPTGGLRNSVSKLAEHVDVRGDGGQVVFVGSIHPDTGRPYVWAPSLSPNDVPLATLPAALLELLAVPNRRPPARDRACGAAPPADLERLRIYAARALQHSSQRLSVATDGHRNDGLNKEAFAMGRFLGAGLLERSQVEAQLLAAAERIGLPPDEARKTLQSGLAAGIREHHTVDDLLAKIKVVPPPREDRIGNPTILIEGGRLPDIVDQAEAALLRDKGPPLFQYGGVPVRVLRLEDSPLSKWLQIGNGALLVRPLTTAHIRERFTRAARFVCRRGKTLVPIDAPERYAKTYLAREGLFGLPILSGVIEAPTLRPDGTILQKAGYDEATGLYFDPGSTSFAPIPSRPSRDDAVRALTRLKELLKDFPWVAACDRAAALSTILTALFRRSLRTAPLTGFRAPTMSSGKSLLVDVVAYFATGRPAPVMTLGTNDEEERKRIFALLFSGVPLASIDNIGRDFGSDALCSVLTQATYSDRILGVSQTAHVSTAIVWMVTGNNLAFRGDITTRVIPCDLDAQCEHPEERKFDVNLHEYVPAHRGELVRDALTVLLAYDHAGRPPQYLSEFGRFEEWSNRVRSALVWCGEADACEGRQRILKSDPVREQLGSVLTNWYALLEDQRLTAAEVIADATTANAAGNSALWDDLRDIAAHRREPPDGRRLGHWLTKFKDRIVGGLRIERSGERRNATVWRVVRVTPIRVSSASSETSLEMTRGDSEPDIAAENHGASDTTRDRQASETDPQNSRNSPTGEPPSLVSR